MRTNEDSCVVTDQEPQPVAEYCLVRLRRPDGTEKILRLPAEHMQRVMDLAAGEFGDPTIIHVGPELPPKE
jgi:hypothetical protein